jgi:hypothetical protein
MDVRLHLLCTGSVGGILLVICLFDTNGPTTESFITILVAPSMATYDPSSTESVVLVFDDIWDKTALTRFNPSLDLALVNHPILVAQEGYSRAARLTGQITGLAFS